MTKMVDQITNFAVKVKGTVSPQAHVRVDKKHFEIVQLFQIPSESSGSCFHLFESRSSTER